VIESFTLIQSTAHSAQTQQIIFTGKQNELTLKWQQRYWVKNKKAMYLLLLPGPKRSQLIRQLLKK
jgi:hypothetical protein